LSPTEYESQFRQWLDEHTGLLFKVVRSFADGPHDSDDLLQDILLQVWLSLPSFSRRIESHDVVVSRGPQHGAGMEAS
jgi:RNA polymerase sigma-70 factor (ECF subfamily)